MTTPTDAFDLIRRLLPLGLLDLPPDPRARDAMLLARLERALRAERSRGLGRHPAYDLRRHALLARAVRALRVRVRAGR